MENCNEDGTNSSEKNAPMNLAHENWKFVEHLLKETKCKQIMINKSIWKFLFSQNKAYSCRKNGQRGHPSGPWTYSYGYIWCWRSM